VDKSYTLLKEILDKRELLPILKTVEGGEVTKENGCERKAEMKKALETYSYGITPPAPDKVWGDILYEAPLREGYAGKVRIQDIRISFETKKGVFSFPVKLLVPIRFEKPPVFLHIAFRRNVPDMYVPAEEITDRGYALAVVCYKDIVNDDLFGDFTDGLAKYFGTTKTRKNNAWGKIGMWAYGASRVLDYLYTRDDVDATRTTVIGHSRLGKTALWTAAQDERFICAVSNDSGYGGAATSKHGEGERVRDFLRCGSWDWYCENFKNYTDEKEDEKPYDQAYLLALIAPRYLYVGSAVEDKGADPKSEFLTTLHASDAWEMLGEKGLVTPDKMPETGDVLHDGKVGYHMRSGMHFLSREDWGYYMDFLEKKGIKGKLK